MPRGLAIMARIFITLLLSLFLNRLWQPIQPLFHFLEQIELVIE